MQKTTTWLGFAAVLGAMGCGSDDGNKASPDAGLGGNLPGQSQGDGDGDAEDGNQNPPASGGPCGKGKFPSATYNDDYNFCTSTDPLQDCLSISLAQDYSEFPGQMHVHGQPDLSELSCMTSAADITISGNPDLENLQGFNKLTALKALMVIDNPALTSLEGLDKLESAELLHVMGNANTDMKGVPDGLMVEDLIIEYSDNLTSLDGLEGIVVTNSIAIGDNPLLPQCEVDKFVARFPDLELDVKTSNSGTGSCN